MYSFPSLISENTYFTSCIKPCILRKKPRVTRHNPSQMALKYLNFTSCLRTMPIIYGCVRLAVDVAEVLQVLLCFISL